jgi:hypothetical protein
MSELYKIQEIISPTAVLLHIPKICKIYPVFHVSLIELFVKGNKNMDLKAVMKTSKQIENAPEYVVDKVIVYEKTTGEFYTS